MKYILTFITITFSSTAWAHHESFMYDTNYLVLALVMLFFTLLNRSTT